MKPVDILSLTPGELAVQMAELGQPAYRAEQIFQWLHQKNAAVFDDMKNLPKALRAGLESRYYIPAVVPVEKLVSKKDGTAKYLFGFDETKSTLIEAVLMKYSHGHSLCISTQAGCRMGCTFCASASTGLMRNLTAGEMCAQVYGAGRDCERIGSIVLMGCGEPLDNFDESLRFIELITHPKGANIGQRHITLSTCGMVPEIRALADLKPQITLAVSLHGATDDVRKILMPVTNRYPLKDLINVCRYYIEQTHRRITFEYALAKDVNDAPLHAKELVRLLRGINCHVNIIPINKARGVFSPTPRKDVDAFAEILKGSNIQTTIRRSLGGDVAAACGQLRARY